MKRLFAGLDVSTQSCKLVVINPAEKKIEFVVSVNYDHDLPQYNTFNGVIQTQPEGVSESDPRMWIDAVNMVFEQLKESDVPQNQIYSISVSGQQHGLVALDEKGNLTRPTSKLWNDFSTSEECEILTEKVGGRRAMIEEVGNAQRTGYTASKIFHFFRHEREQYDKTATFFLVHNYVNWYLTGGARVMEAGDTSGTALWHPGKRRWSQKVINAIDPSLKDKLPEVKSSAQSIGKISSGLARRFGFNRQCTIDAGSGDNMYGAIGTGNIEPGVVTISLGTSGTAYSFTEEPFIDSEGDIAAFCDATGHYLPLLCVSNLANGYNILLKQYQITHEEFNQIVGKTPAGNRGRILIPWYEGERTPDVAQAAPLYFGFGLNDFKPEILTRAVLEGHVLNLYDGFRRMPVKPREIRLTGGLSKSEIWVQTIADVFEADAVPVRGEGAALGAAIHAAWVWFKEHGYKTELKELTESFVLLDETRRKSPVEENVQTYRRMKKLFHALSARMRGVPAEDPFLLRYRLINWLRKKT